MKTKLFAYLRTTLSPPLGLAAKALAYMLIVGTGSLIADGARAECLSDASRFANKPNQERYNALKKPNTQAVREECWDEIIREKTWTENNVPCVSQPLFDKVIGKVSNGNRWAALFIAANLNRLDGGDLEDGLVALGLTMNKDPSLVLRLYRDGIIPEAAFKWCVASRPLKLVDNDTATLAFLKQRRKKILSVKMRELVDAKKTALASLDEAIRDYQRHAIEEQTQ